MTKTALFSEATLFIAECLVSFSLDCIRVVKKGTMSIQRGYSYLSIRLGIQIARCTMLWLFVSLGNGIGSGSPKLQPLFMLGCANLSSMLVNMYFNAFSVRIEKRMIDDSDKDEDGPDSTQGGSGTSTDSGILDSPPHPLPPAPQEARAQPGSSRGPRLPPRRTRGPSQNRRSTRPPGGDNQGLEPSTP